MSRKILLQLNYLHDLDLINGLRKKTHKKNKLTKRIGIKYICGSDYYTFVYLDDEQRLLAKDKRYMIFSSITLFIKLLP